MRPTSKVFFRLALGLFLLGAPAREAWAAARAPAQGRHGMVVTGQVDAARAGHEILARGGNAIDAAVAASFALAVSDPYHSGIGGGAFLLIRLASGEVVALDARETAPAAADRDMFVREGVEEHASRVGKLAVGVPGHVAGAALALERWGTMSLAEVLEPAIRLAEEGFEIGPRHARAAKRWMQYRLHERFPETAAIQLPPAGEEIRAGWRLRQPELAETLRTIARDGAKAFYEGDLAAAIVAEMERRGGLLTRADLAGYEARVREPIRGSYRGLEVLSFPPPSSGGIALVEILNVLSGFDLAGLGAGSSASLHRVAESMKLAFADRAAYLGDSDFVDVPTAELVSAAYADALRARMNPGWLRKAPWYWGRERALTVKTPGLPQEDGGTMHLSVTDAEGNAVAITQTINLLYGSGVTVKGTGILLNNEMDDFSIAPNRPNAFGLVDTRGANAVAPSKRPLSSMTPTIVVRDGKVFMVSGSPGGPRIITTTLLTLLNVIDWGMNVQEAVSAPRFHHQWVPDRLLVERAFPRDVVDALRARGHEVKISERDWSSAQAIVIDAETGIHYGGTDPRTDGAALGFNP
ncbi:MAG: gamma-glutamyltransferase [Deltaproteobacteria bacterium]|nr:gamma-glutamyltransferase [Deltaproteobacteria bacterium]